MFVALGVVTVMIGVMTGAWLPDTPVLLKHVAVNRTGIRNREFKAMQVLEVVLDVQMWLMTLLTILGSSTNLLKLCHLLTRLAI